MDALQIGFAVGGAATGVIGTLFALRRDHRDEEQRENKRDDRILSAMRTFLSQEIRVLEAHGETALVLSRATQASVDTLSRTVETKLVTQQEHSLLTMRVDANQHRIEVLEKEMRDTQIRCARSGHSTGTAAIQRQA